MKHKITMYDDKVFYIETKGSKTLEESYVDTEQGKIFISDYGVPIFKDRVFKVEVKDEH